MNVAVFYHIDLNIDDKGAESESLKRHTSGEFPLYYNVLFHLIK